MMSTKLLNPRNSAISSHHSDKAAQNRQQFLRWPLCSLAMRDRQAVYRYRELGHEVCMGLRKVGIQSRIQAVQNRSSATHIESERSDK